MHLFRHNFDHDYYCEWAKKRIGKSLAQVDEFRHSDVEDKLMREYLEEEGLLPKSTASEPDEV